MQIIYFNLIKIKILLHKIELNNIKHANKKSLIMYLPNHLFKEKNSKVKANI